jgi:hypothetical protein
MFQRIVVLGGSEGAERAIPIAVGVEVSEKDLADAASYLAALQAAYAKGKKSQASSTDSLQASSTESMQEAARYCQLNFFC